MKKLLLSCFFLSCIWSCRFSAEKTGQVLVNQQLIESNIQSVQTAEHIDLSIKTTNNHDSILIVKLTVDPKIPNDSLNAYRAKVILSSFITILPGMRTFKSCKIIFFKKEGVLTGRSIEFICPMTEELAIRVTNYKDSTKTSMGYINPDWTYINKNLNLSLPLKTGWFFASEENDSLVFYSIGSDVNQLPQYRLDSDRNVTFQTLGSLDPGDAKSILQICKNNALFKGAQQVKTTYPGPVIDVGLTMNLFDSEDEYLKNLNELVYDKKLPENEIKNFSFGNADFRGHQFTHAMGNGKQIYNLMAIRRFRRVSLVLRIIYSNPKELEEIKYELSGLKVN